MATIPAWRLGRHESITITGCTLSSNTLTPSASAGDIVNCTAILESVSMNGRTNVEEINAATSTIDHEVPISDNFAMTISVIETNNQALKTSPLLDLWNRFDYFRVVRVVGSGVGARTVTTYHSRGDYSDGTQGRGKQIATLTLNSIDAGSDSIGVAFAS